MPNKDWLAYNDLVHYDEKIKKYINDKDTLVKESTYSKDELDARLADLKRIKEDLAKLYAEIEVQEEAIANLKDHIDEDEAAILVLQADDKLIREDIADLRVEVENKLDESAMAYLATKEDLQGLATEEYVKDQIREAQLEAGDIDLSDYAKKTDLDNLADSMLNQNAALSKRLDDQTAVLSAVHNEIDNVQNNLEQYITESELAARNYATLDKLESYATKDYVADAISNIPEVPTKVSDLENDAGFITEIPSEYITENELEQKGYITEHQSLENYATKEFVAESIGSITIPDVSSFITMEDVEAKNYATEQYVLDHMNTTIETEVEKQVTQVIQTQVKDEITIAIDNNTKLQYGEF